MLLETEHLGGYANEADNIYSAVTNEAITMNNDNNNNNNHNNNIGEITDSHDSGIRSGTAIQNFYAGQSVFITGGTGFLGKILVEKLLRSCPDITTIYLLIRTKKNKNAQNRIDDIFNSPIYDRLREEFPKFRHKLVAISGDCSIPGLGLSSSDRERLVQEVSIVFHSAATVRFDEKMDVALAINVGSTSDIIDLCRGMQKLKAFMHVSTAYANCHEHNIDETFYSHPYKYEDLKDLVSGKSDSEIAEITPKLLGKWPNTYTFTKALAEVVVRNKCQGLNIGIFRPAIVISSAYEPMPGWIDNFYGPTGAVAAILSGILKTMYCRHAIKANVVPVDFTVNALIASAWDVANKPERRDENMLIYNFVSTVDNSITWKEYSKINLVYAHEYPYSGAKWRVTMSLQNFRIPYILHKIFLHYIPALFIDFFCIIVGIKPMMINAYRKIDKFLNVITWFCIHERIFTNDNIRAMWERLETKDKQNFRFNIKDLNWSKYFKNYMKGVRIYLLKDDLSTLEASRKKMERLSWIDDTIKFLLYTFLLWLLWKIIPVIFF